MIFIQDLVSEPSSQHFIATNDSKLEVKVRLDLDGEPEFKNLLSLASAGEKPLAVDTEEIDKVQALETPKRDLKTVGTPDRKSTPSKQSRAQSRSQSRKCMKCLFSGISFFPLLGIFC